MRVLRQTWHAIRWPVFTALVVSALYLGRVFEPLELLTQDVRFVLRGYQKGASSDVAVVGITQACINQFGPLPWPRSRYAEILDRLREAGARVICMDLFFPVPSRPEQDAALERAIREAGNVILPVFCPVALRNYRPGPIRHVDRLRENLPRFSRCARGLGHINVPPALDRKCRAIPYGIEYRKRVYYALSVEAASMFRAAQAGKKGLIRVLRPPLTPEGDFLINFHGQGAALPVVTASSVLKGEAPRDLFKGRVVLVGQTALGLVNADVIPTPLGQMFGVLVQATAIDNLLKNEVLRRETPAMAMLVILAVSLASAWLYRRTSPLLAVSIFLLGAAAVGSTALHLFLFRNLMMDVAPPTIVMALNLSWALVIKTIESRRAAAERESEIAAIVDTGRLSVEAEEPETIPEALVELLGGTIGVDVASLSLVSARDAWYWLPPNPAGSDSLQAGDVPDIRDFESAAADFLLHRAPYFMTTDISTDAELPVRAGFSTRSFLSIPLVVRGRAFGFICFYNKRPSMVAPRETFTEEDVRLAWVLCREAALILDNQQLVASLQEKNIRLQHALEQLREAQEQIVQAEKLSAVGRMAAMIVHDIRNALTGISGITELMQSSVDPMFQELLQSVQQRVEDIRAMSQEILDYTRDESTLELSEIDPGKLIQSVLEQLRQAFPHSDIRWVSEITCHDGLLGDERKLQRVLLNLGRNAAEAMAGRGVFRLGCRRWAEGIEFIAEDSGPGIPEDIRDSLFEPFVTQGKKHGTGLGLAIVKRTIEEHGGRIWFLSRRGEGTRFHIRLPWRPPAGADARIGREDE